jgi:transcriptional regulator GlxA family with amidase domain
LSPGAMRRVREYVEVHLDENIDLLMLAGVAGLLVHHFARQFKQSAGVTPHVYLTRKRVERAKEMLVQTDLSLAEIAFSVGFFDQGHLARHFRQMLGTTPRTHTLERAEAQDFPVTIARGIFSFLQVIEVSPPGIPRSRRQWAGL